MIRFCPLFSSSSGNSVYIGEKNSGILIDVGRSAKQTREMLNKIGVEESAVKAVFLTHEHADHVAGLSVFLKKNNINVTIRREFGKKVSAACGQLRANYEEE